MAVLAFAAVGSGLAGAVGSAAGIAASSAVAFGMTAAGLGAVVGGAIGSYVDSVFLYPRLFGRDQDIQGPKIDDFQVQTASEGTAVNWCLGPENRLAGNIIWMSDLIEVHTETETGGGKGGGGQSVTNREYFVDVAVAVCEIPDIDTPVSAIKKIWAEGKLIYDNGTTDARYQGITIYDGDIDQSVDPLIESYEGSGNVPAFRGLCYVVFNRLALADWGNRVPQFSFLVEAHETLSLADAVGTILERGGRSSSDYDVDSLVGTVRGYNLPGPQPTLRALEPLIFANNLAVRDSGTQLVFYPRTTGAIVTISADDLAAHEDGEETHDPLTVADMPSFDLPSEVNISFLDPALNYQRASQRQQKTDYVKEVVINTDLPMVMTASDARKLCRQILWSTWAERFTALPVYLPPSYLTIEAGDILEVEYRGETYQFVVSENARGYNHVTELKGFSVDLETLEQTGVAEDPDPLEDTPYTPPELDVVFIDTPALSSAELDGPGIYYALYATDPDASFRGARVYFGTYEWVYHGPGVPPVSTLKFEEVIRDVSGEATIGETSNALGDVQSPYHWDYENTVEVVLDNGSLESRGPLEVLGGANVLLIGDELVAFAEATLTAPRTYTLSRLLRGLRGTERYTGSHAIGDRVVLLSRNTVFWHDYQGRYGNLLNEQHYKAVPLYQVVEDVTQETVEPQGNNLRELPPVHLKGIRNADNDLTVTWIRRGRGFTNLFGPYGTVPDLSGTSTETYQVEYLNGGGSVVRTVTVSGSTTATYTAAQQTADGLTPGNAVTVRISQLSATTGWGFPATADL